MLHLYSFQYETLSLVVHPRQVMMFRQYRAMDLLPNVKEILRVHYVIPILGLSATPVKRPVKY